MITIQQLVADAYATRGGAAQLARDLGVGQSTLTRVLGGSVPSANLMARATRLRPDLDLHATIAAGPVGAVLSDDWRGGLRAVWADGEVRLRQGGRWTWIDGVKQRIPWGRAYRLLGEAKSCAEWREGVRDEG